VAHFTFVDLFAGIGGFRIPCEALGGECLAFAENSKSAISIYNENFSQAPNLGNVQTFAKINSDKPIDLITAGVPCQPWSVAGKNKGFKDPRGRLWFSTINIIKENRPKVFIIENVAGLSDPRNESNLKQIKDLFTEIGYKFKIFELSARDFGVVQDRVRVFIVGFKNETYLKRISSIEKNTRYKTIGNILYPNLKIKNTNSKFPQNFRIADVRGGDTTFHSWDLIQTSPEEKTACNLILSKRRSLGKKIYGKDGAPLSINDIYKETGIRIKKSVIVSLIEKGILIEPKENRYDFKHSRYGLGVNIEYSKRDKRFEINSSNEGVFRILTLSSKEFPTITASRQYDYICTDIIKQSSSLKQYKASFVSNILKTNKYRIPNKSQKLSLQGFPEDFKTYTVSDSVAEFHIGNAVPPPVVLNILKATIKTRVFDVK